MDDIDRRLARELEIFESRSKTLALPSASGPRPLRLCWIGKDASHWACLAMREEDFDPASAAALGSSASTSAPWAHAGNAMAMIVERALEKAPETMARRISTLRKAAPDNAFSAPRMANSISFFLAEPGADLAAALLAAGGQLPGSWALSGQGGSLPKIAPESFLGAMDFDDAYGAGAAPDPQMQVDGAGLAHWLWLPAAARALGSPVKLSISRRGISHALAWGDILGAANKAAAEDPHGFWDRFAEAIMPLEHPAGKAAGGGLDDHSNAAIAEFERRDRLEALRSELKAAAPDPGAAPAQGGRL